MPCHLQVKDMQTKYGNVSEIVNAHIKEVMGLQTVNGSNPRKINEFYETLLRNVQALETIGKLNSIEGLVSMTLDKQIWYSMTNSGNSGHSRSWLTHLENPVSADHHGEAQMVVKRMLPTVVLAIGSLQNTFGKTALPEEKKCSAQWKSERDVRIATIRHTKPTNARRFKMSIRDGKSSKTRGYASTASRMHTGLQIATVLLYADNAEQNTTRRCARRRSRRRTWR